MQKMDHPDPKEMREIYAAMQESMLNMGLSHVDKIGARPLRVLQHLQLWNDPEEPLGDDLDPDVISDESHPLHEKHSFGPLVFFRTDGEKPERHVRELPTLLLADNQKLRAAALQILERFLYDPELHSTPKTQTLIREQKERILSFDPLEWMPAAVAAYDALNDDFLISLAGMKQCMECEPVLADSLKDFNRKVLFPKVSSLDTIGPTAAEGERDSSILDKMLQKVVSEMADDLPSLCDNYLKFMGFLPLAPRYSLRSVLRKFEDNGNTSTLWDTLWEWADQHSSPLATFHACSVFVLEPNLIPDGKLEETWDRILDLIAPVENGEDETQSSALEVRSSLARHYLFHLESYFPENDGASVSALAWWLAERVADLFPSDPKSSGYYLENWIKPVLSQSMLIWTTAGAYVEPSYLRFLTLNGSSMWSTALFAHMGEHMDQLLEMELPEDTKMRFHNALVTNLLTSFPLQLNAAENPVFAQECSISQVVSKLAEVCDKEISEGLIQVLETSKSLGSVEAACGALKELDTKSLVDQAAICLFLRGMIMMNPSVGEKVWDVVADADWRKEILATREANTFSMLMEILNRLMIQCKGDWSSELPHFVAEMTEQSNDDEKRSNLFYLVLHLCMASETTSAVRRLLRGNQKEQYLEQVRKYREVVVKEQNKYPAWVQAKIRGLLAELYVV
jgi:hypothetical protein